ncbi:MAG: LysE family transporter [Candidatus Thorarchaeota archaeon]|jgi:threonine/homoserine/homoserine lactone efflux protein
MGVADVIFVLAGWFVLSLSGALAPGPLSAAVIQQASKRDRLHGILPMVGHALVELVIITAIILGVSSAILDPYTDLLMGFGGVIIILFGLVAMRDYKQEETGSSVEVKQEMTASSALEATTQGALVSIFSPYFILWWLAAGFTAITYLLENVQWSVEAVFIAGVLIYFTHISTDFIFGAFLSVGASYGSEKAQVDSKAGRLNLVNIGIGLFQVVLGLSFIVLALPGLIFGT